MFEATSTSSTASPIPRASETRVVTARAGQSPGGPRTPDSDSGFLWKKAAHFAPPRFFTYSEPPSRAFPTPTKVRVAPETSSTGGKLVFTHGNRLGRSLAEVLLHVVGAFGLGAEAGRLRVLEEPYAKDPRRRFYSPQGVSSRPHAPSPRGRGRRPRPSRSCP